MSFSLGIAVPPDMLVIPFEHQNFLLLLAITIAVAAAFVTQSLMEYMIMRLRAGIAQWQLYVSVALAAFCLGAGVWSLHFISLLALQVPIQRSYDVGLTLLSLLLACAAALASLVLLAKSALKHRLLYAGLISAMGILSMHYTGMWSMRSIAIQLHNPWWLLVTVPLAVAVGMLGYFLVERLLRTTRLISYLALKVSISLLLALGVAAVHGVGMHGMQLLVPVDLQAFVQHASSPDTELGLVVGMITLLIMLIGLVGSSWGQQVIRQQSSALSRAAMRLQQASDYDPLTGLYNSRAFREKLHQRLSVQADEQPALVLWLDLDQFKRINDSLGHAHGDDLLVQVALRLRAALSGNALLGRYAADEFCVLVNDADLDSLEALPQRLRDQLEPPFSVGDTTLQLSASIGFTYFPDDGREPGELLRDAGIALGWCKKNGRNRSQRFSMTLAGEAQMDLRLEQDLREALDQDGLEVFYQPIVRAEDGHVEGLEALVRWPHALFGMINPERFVGLAEQCGLIGELDDWVMRRACRDVCRLHGQGLELRVGVNCSALNLSDPDLPARVDNALRSSCLPAAYLTIEITENALMGNLLQAADSLQKIRELGVRVSIDDFGTGYSSLAYLRRLPVNTLKIDRSFVRELDTNQQDQELTGAIIAMAHKLQLRVVAEGVESLKHAALLRSQQCDLLQGFWFSKPLPVADLLEWLSLYRPIDVLPPQAQQQVS